MTLPHPPMVRRQATLAALALSLSALSTASWAQTPIQAVASFSILGDLVRQVGGDRVSVNVLVGPGSDAHVFQSTPTQARQVSQAQVVFSNGLGFEGWMSRLLKTANYRGQQVVASQGVKPITGTEHGHDHNHGHSAPDPHAWQSVSNALMYVNNISQGLCAADAAGCDTYKANATAYSTALKALDTDIRAQWAAIPAAKRKVITSHDAFGYFADHYGLDIIGSIAEGDAAAPGAARLMELRGTIEAGEVLCMFPEAQHDPALVTQMTEGTGAKVGGALDPVGSSLEPGQGAYAALLTGMAQTIADCVGG